MSTIEVFADVSCPFTYVQLDQLMTRRTDLGLGRLAIRVRAWPLELVNDSPPDPTLIAEQVAALREQIRSPLFSSFEPRRFPTSTLPALVLAEAAYRKDAATGEQVSLSLRRALFTQGQDISKPALLAEIAETFALKSTGTGERDGVLADWRAGQSRDVEGSPHCFCGDLSAFSPGLQISKDDGTIRVKSTTSALDAFLTSCDESDA